MDHYQEFSITNLTTEQTNHKTSSTSLYRTISPNHKCFPTSSFPPLHTICPNTTAPSWSNNFWVSIYYQFQCTPSQAYQLTTNTNNPIISTNSDYIHQPSTQFLTIITPEPLVIDMMILPNDSPPPDPTPKGNRFDALMDNNEDVAVIQQANTTNSSNNNAPPNDTIQDMNIDNPTKPTSYDKTNTNNLQSPRSLQRHITSPLPPSALTSNNPRLSNTLLKAQTHQKCPQPPNHKLSFITSQPTNLP